MEYLPIGQLKKKVGICCRWRVCLLSTFLIVIMPAIKTYQQREFIFSPFLESDSVRRAMEKSLQESLRYDKGMGCEIPYFDPFSMEIMAFNTEYPKVTCGTKLSWVKCYLSKCKVVDEILNAESEVKCVYSDILFIDEWKYKLGLPTVVEGDGVYYLERSDHVKIECIGYRKRSFLPAATSWIGYGVGYRQNIELKSPPADRVGSIDILILGFDSTSKNGFIRKMPKSYKYLKNELGVTFLNGYSILGDGTPAALFPILSGKSELEFPDARRRAKIKNYLNADEFIFSKLKQYGYRTAFYEDSPSIGTFQYRFHGFSHQPADHYLRALLVDDKLSKKYCFGDTPLYNVMMNLTDQFFKLPGKHYIFTFIADICHDEYNQLSTADDDTLNFLKNLKRRGVFDNTMMLFMGDHGPRYTSVRQTSQGKYEERLPLMSILLPKVLKERRPKIQAILEDNVNVLTTAHDIHTTVLDALDLMHLRNKYRIQGADMDRALTLFEPIPKNRSCSTAGIETHWCVCVSWDNVTHTDVLYHRTAEAFVAYINSLTEEFRSQCVPRTLSHISWVMKQRVNNKLMAFVGSSDIDGFKPIFDKEVNLDRVFLQIKVTLGPSDGVFEASTTYLKKEDKFIFNMRDITRTNMYHNEPDCIRGIRPEIEMFCYCKY